MTQTEILEIEKSREINGNYATIYLFAEGSFYRAYDWSAWLCFRYINQFKPTKRELKNENGDTIVYVGFPVTSLSRYIPENGTTVSREDKGVEVDLPIETFSGVELESLKKDFQNWKNSVPVAVSKKSSVREDLKNGGGEQPHRMSEIMFKILAYPLEQKSPMECMSFIAELKQQITSLL